MARFPYSVDPVREVDRYTPFTGNLIFLRANRTSNEVSNAISECAAEMSSHQLHSTVDAELQTTCTRSTHFTVEIPTKMRNICALPSSGRLGFRRRKSEPKTAKVVFALK